MKSFRFENVIVMSWLNDKPVATLPCAVALELMQESQRYSDNNLTAAVRYLTETKYGIPAEMPIKFVEESEYLRSRDTIPAIDDTLLNMSDVELAC
jgi:hypothetical protein